MSSLTLTTPISRCDITTYTIIYAIIHFDTGTVTYIVQAQDIDGNNIGLQFNVDLSLSDAATRITNFSKFAYDDIMKTLGIVGTVQ